LARETDLSDRVHATVRALALVCDANLCGFPVFPLRCAPVLGLNNN
jgi:hypothetical protein